MAKLTWNNTAEHFYETGVKDCVLYVKGSNGAYGAGVAWNGVTGITESPSGAEATALYADDRKYAELLSKEEFGATLEAYMYPTEFAGCNGYVEVDGLIIGQQPRSAFGLSYITSKGSADDSEAGSILHIIYNCKAAPSEKAYTTINDSPEAITFSWEITTTAEDPGSDCKVNGKVVKPTAHLEIDSTKLENGIENEKWTALIDKLQGSASGDAKLPALATIIKFFSGEVETLDEEAA